MSSKPINLQLGWPSKSLFPTAALNQASNTVFQTQSLAGDALIYGPDPGHQPLRESLATWLTTFYNQDGEGSTIDASNIFVSNGASMALEIMLQKFTDPVFTRRIFMVEPTYFLACPIFEDAGFEGHLRGVPEDEEGFDIGFLRRELEKTEKEAINGVKVERVKSENKYPKLYKYVIYVVPTFANPSGKVMSLRRRKELVQLARDFDALVVTDDVYDMLRWPVEPNLSTSELPPPPPRLVDLDREIPGQSKFGNVASNGSFSKLVAPGVRVGWVQGTPDFINTLLTHGSTKSGGSPGHMSSVLIDQMLRTGSLDKHLAEVMIPTYRKRYAVMMDAIEEHLKPLGARVTTGQTYKHDDHAGHATVAEAGGFFTYLTLPDDLQPAVTVAKTALDSYELKVAHGAMMVVAGDADCLERGKTTFGRGLRLSWSWHDEDEIREGICRLADVMRDIRNGSVKQTQAGTSAALGLV